MYIIYISKNSICGGKQQHLSLLPNRVSYIPAPSSKAVLSIEIALKMGLAVNRY